ncbi:platelet-activating factor receptor-like [Narcine bancroftii]|uniref:platelet-activating factor receptor-like n=1 Tax=Narcine bancroftii TaxID=1343680 RepID=UPI0038311917
MNTTESLLWNVTKEPLNMIETTMNSSENYSWVARTVPDACDPWHPVQNFILPLVYLVVLFVGLLGNCVALLIFLQNDRKVKKAIRVYLINLTLADIMFNATLPFWVVYYFKGRDWIFSEAMCRMAGVFYYVATYSAITFMILISINRYCTVRMTKLPLPLNEPTGSLYTCGFVWMFWLACGIPALLEQQTTRWGLNAIRCFEEYSRSTIFVYMSFIFFLVSFLFVLLSYISIMRALTSQGNALQGMHRRLARSMVLGMVIVFLLCVLPYHVSLIPWEMNRANSKDMPGCTQISGVDIVHKLNLALLSMNSCVDPIIYCFSVKRFRRELNKVFRKLVRRLPFQPHTVEASETHIRSNSLTTS